MYRPKSCRAVRSPSNSFLGRWFGFRVYNSAGFKERAARTNEHTRHDYPSRQFYFECGTIMQLPLSQRLPISRRVSRFCRGTHSTLSRLHLKLPRPVGATDESKDIKHASTINHFLSHNPYWQSKSSQLLLHNSPPQHHFSIFTSPKTVSFPLSSSPAKICFRPA
jgi:hypothetical protein